MNIALGIGAAIVALAATWILLKMLFQGLVVLVKMAGFASLALAAAYTTIHTAELTDPDLGGLRGVFDQVQHDVAQKLDVLPRIKVSFELPESSQLAAESELVTSRKF